MEINKDLLNHMNKLQYVKLQLTAHNDECPICYEDKYIKDWFYCGHHICLACFNKIRMPVRCPCCRKVYNPKHSIIFKQY